MLKGEEVKKFQGKVLAYIPSAFISNDRQWHHHSKQFPFRLNKMWFSGENGQHKPKSSDVAEKPVCASGDTTIQPWLDPRRRNNARSDFTPLKAQSEVPKEARTGWISEEETLWCWRRQREEDSLGKQNDLESDLSAYLRRSLEGKCTRTTFSSVWEWRPARPSSPAWASFQACSSPAAVEQCDPGQASEAREPDQ